MICATDKLTATLVLLEVDGALGEDHGATSVDRVEDETSAVLLDHPARDGAVDHVEHLSGTGVGVRGVHTARAQETDGHSKACPSQVMRSKCLMTAWL